LASPTVLVELAAWEVGPPLCTRRVGPGQLRGEGGEGFVTSGKSAPRVDGSSQGFVINQSCQIGPPRNPMHSPGEAGPLSPFHRPDMPSWPPPPEVGPQPKQAICPPDFLGFTSQGKLAPITFSRPRHAILAPSNVAHVPDKPS